MEFTSNILSENGPESGWIGAGREAENEEAESEEAESAELQNGMNKMIYVTAKAQEDKPIKHRSIFKTCLHLSAQTMIMNFEKRKTNLSAQAPYRFFKTQFLLQWGTG